MRNRIVIVNNFSRGVFYGIGTYVDSLSKSLDTNPCFEYVFVNLFCKGESVNLSNDNNRMTINIPSVKFRDKHSMKRYARNVSFLLMDFISAESKDKLIFHFNFMTVPELVDAIKKKYPKCRTLLVSHYTNWSFDLLGNERQFNNIMCKPTYKRTLLDKKILRDFRNDCSMIKKVDKLVCVAKHTLDPFIRYGGIDESKCKVISNALDDEYKDITAESRRELRCKYRISEEEEVILFVGRLDVVKGVESLLESFDKILDSRPKAHLYLVGEGDFNVWLHLSKNNWSHISFTGHLNKQQVNDFYNIADVGVIPSLHEEFGLVAIEMMMHRLPIVVSDVGGLSEIVVDNITGLKIPVSYDGDRRMLSPDCICAKIIKLLDDRAFSQTLANNGRKRFLEHYENNAFKNKMLELYSEL